MHKHFALLGLLCITYALVARSNSLVVILFSLAFYVHLLSVNRELAYQLFAVILLNFLDFIDPEVHGRLENVFKFADLFFVVTVVHFVCTRYRAMASEKGVDRTLGALTLALMGFICLQVILTAFRLGEPVLDALQVARRYSYIMLIPIFAGSLDDTQVGIRRSFVITLSAVVLVLNGINYVFGYNGFPPHARYGTWDYGNTVVVKSYLSGVILVFALCFYSWARFDSKTYQSPLQYFVPAGLTFALITVSFRVLWFAGALALFGLFLAQAKERFRVVAVVVISFACVFLLFRITGANDMTMRVIIDPIADAYEDISSGDPSMTGRLQADVFRIEAFLERPFLGAGFVHERFLGASLGTIDSGYLDLLVNFGILGTAIVVALYWLLYRSAKWNDGPWARTTKMFVILSVASLPAAALMSSVTYGYLPLALIYSLRERTVRRDLIGPV